MLNIETMAKKIKQNSKRKMKGGKMNKKTLNKKNKKQLNKKTKLNKQKGGLSFGKPCALYSNVNDYKFMKVFFVVGGKDLQVNIEQNYVEVKPKPESKRKTETKKPEIKQINEIEAQFKNPGKKIFMVYFLSDTEIKFDGSNTPILREENGKYKIPFSNNTKCAMNNMSVLLKNAIDLPTLPREPVVNRAYNIGNEPHHYYSANNVRNRFFINPMYGTGTGTGTEKEHIYETVVGEPVRLETEGFYANIGEGGRQLEAPSEFSGEEQIYVDPESLRVPSSNEVQKLEEEKKNPLYMEMRSPQKKKLEHTPEGLKSESEA